MQRTLDILLAALGLTVGAPVLLLLLLAGYCDTRSPLFIQLRVGRDERPFRLVKFRTMKRGTASVATHLADAAAVTRLGAFLRRTKLDELPQLWNVLTGNMSLVGPRPCLPSQTELVVCRRQYGVFGVRPGITGLAQVRGIDMSTPELLARTDAQMISEMTLKRYFYYILITAVGRGTGDRVRQG
ncbi:sugar transferase [Marinobacter sp. C2H3]|uniref:sugar transferase n=1 Tax=Marinobacter sp. C2H3 TaxID=3119003 RepID=UPI00300F6E45